MDCQSRVKLAYKIRGDLIKAIDRTTKPKYEKQTKIVYQIITKSESDAASKNLDDGSVLHEELVEITEVDEDYNVIGSTGNGSGNAGETEQPVFLHGTEHPETKSSEVEIDYLNENENNNDDDDGELIIDGEEDAVSFLLDKKELFQDKGENKSTAQRRHRCEVCEKTFMRKSNLVDHLRLHANVRNFRCEYCSKEFVQAGNYRSHLRVNKKKRYKTKMKNLYKLKKTFVHKFYILHFGLHFFSHDYH